MSKLTRTLALLAVLAMSATAFTACNGGSESSNDSSSATESSADESSADESSADESSADESSDEESSGEETPSADLTDDDPTLSIVAWNTNDLGPMMELYGNDAVQYVNCGDSGGDASTKYASFLGSGVDIDLFVAEAGWILNYINDEYALPVSELGLTKDDYKDAYQYTVDVATNENGDLMGCSWQAAAGGWAYNTDIAKEQLGIESPEDMQAAVADWDKFEETAGKLKDATGGSVYMTCSLGGMWQCYSTAIDSAWVEDGVINTATAKDFAEMAKKYVDNGYVNPDIAQWDGDWYNYGLDGKCLGYFFSTWCLTEGAQLEGNCGTDGNWNIVVGPQEYFWGGSWLCVAKTINTKATAADFIRYFTVNKDSMKEYALKSGDFVNNKVAMSEIVEEGSNSNPLLGGQDQFAVLTGVADGINMSDSITKYDQSLKDSFLNTLKDEVATTDVDTIISDFLKDATSKNTDLSAPEA